MYNTKSPSEYWSEPFAIDDTSGLRLYRTYLRKDIVKKVVVVNFWIQILQNTPTTNHHSLKRLHIFAKQKLTSHNLYLIYILIMEVQFLKDVSSILNWWQNTPLTGEIKC